MENTEHTPSQVIDPPTPTMENPATTPEPPKEEPKPAKMTAEAAIEKAMGPEKAEEETKPEKVEKNKTVPEVKPATAEKSAEPEKADAGERVAPRKVEGQSEGRKIIEAPARFLPRAKELWNNVPHPVREEWQRIETEREAEISQYREAKQLSDDLAEFDRMAKSSGTTLKQAMSNYVGMENAFRSDPAQGFRALMSNLQMQPQQAISHILRAYGVSPQQLAAHMTQNPNDYTALAQPQQRVAPQTYQQPAQEQENPQVRALEERLARMEEERVAKDIITPFAKECPEYYQNEEQIAKILKSGIIEQIHGNGLSPRDKLEVALFMAAPNARRSIEHEIDNEASVPANRDIPPAVDLRGTKSIKGAPHGVQTDRRGKMSREDAINEAMARFGS